MDAREIRRGNLRELAENVATSKAELAVKLVTSPSYLSQMLSDSAKGNVGDDMARRAEKAYDLPHGWMDHFHDKSEADIVEQRSEFKSLESQLTPDEREHLNKLMTLIIEKREVLKKLL